MSHIQINDQLITLLSDGDWEDTAGNTYPSNYLFGSGPWGCLFYRKINTGRFTLNYLYVKTETEVNLTIVQEEARAAMFIHGRTTEDLMTSLDHLIQDIPKDSEHDYFPVVPLPSLPHYFSLNYGTEWPLRLKSKESRVIVSIELSVDYLKEVTGKFFKLGGFYGKVIHRIYCVCLPLREINSHNSVTESFKNIFQDIDDLSVDVQNIYLNGVCESVFLKCINQLFLVSFITDNNDSQLLDTTVEAAGLLTDNLKNPPTIYSLQRKMGVSVKRIRKGFKLFFGISTQGYLNEKRLERAVNLLLNTRMSLLDIALEVGYSEQDSLNKLFKKKLGYTPGFLRS